MITAHYIPSAFQESPRISPGYPDDYDKVWGFEDVLLANHDHALASNSEAPSVGSGLWSPLGDGEHMADKRLKLPGEAESPIDQLQHHAHHAVINRPKQLSPVAC